MRFSYTVKWSANYTWKHNLLDLSGRWSAGGPWPLAGGRWGSGRWPVAGGRWALAGGRWPAALAGGPVGRWPVTAGRWGGGRWGRWPVAGGPVAGGPVAGGPVAGGPVAGGRWPKTTIVGGNGLGKNTTTFGAWTFFVCGENETWEFWGGLG